MSKSSSIQIIQGATPYYYHVLPSDMTRATLSPEREAIFQFLSRIGSDRFVDFIIDMLVHVEGHTLIERTDGPGDEKQDILTLDRAGQRHLTQCKHTEHYSKNTDGDELDLMFGACFRKDCRNALYVTNADLTPQAKRYITDKEYLRGSHMHGGTPPGIDYWNGRRIWERASKSNVVLNKWFSGMAQAHALRRFFTDVVITKMPDGEPCTLHASDIAKDLDKSFKANGSPGSRSFDVAIDAQLSLTLSDWFRAAGNLGSLFLLPDHLNLPNAPVRTLRIEALVSEDVGSFDIAEYRDRVAGLIAAVLPDPEAGSWWHILITGPEAFIFVLDIAKPVITAVEEGARFVRVNKAVAPELTWSVGPGKDFAKVVDPDDAHNEAWVHGATQTTVQVLVSQTIPPSDAYEMHLVQDQLVVKMRDYDLRTVPAADATIVEVVRRLSVPEWYVLMSSKGDLYLASPRNAEKQDTDRIKKVLTRRGFDLVVVDEDKRDSILSAIDTSAPTGRIVSGEHSLSTPVVLTERTFWFRREYTLQNNVFANHILELLYFKFGYESQHGYDALGDKTEGTIASEEVLRLLFDPATFRGRRMIDVGFQKDKATVCLRIREKSISSASDLAQEYLNEYDAVFAKVVGHLTRASHGTATDDVNVE